MADLRPTFRTLVTSFTDFLTVAIHTILYERAIYPDASFLTARKYNFPVRQSRHPKVCEWINDAVAAVETELLKGVVDRVVIIVYSKDSQPLERFVIDVSRFPVVSLADTDTPLERSATNADKIPILPTVDLEEQCRATMSALANCGSLLSPLPNSCTFTLAIELKGEGNAPIGHPQPWVPVQPADNKGSDGISYNRTTPLRAVSAGDFIFETWVEESEERSGR